MIWAAIKRLGVDFTRTRVTRQSNQGHPKMPGSTWQSLKRPRARVEFDGVPRRRAPGSIQLLRPFVELRGK